MKKILFGTLLMFITLSFGQTNLTQLSKLNYQTLHNTELNDVWGYVDELGNEYALVGGVRGTSVVDVTNPAVPVEKFWEPGMNSTWRDLKTYGDYAFVTTEAQNGLLIIDLSPLPQSSALPVAYYTGPSNAQWKSAHNLYVDSNGYAYIFGANRGQGGVIILDVHTDPMNPVEVGVFDNWYVHDGFTRNDTLFLAHISDGFISMVDVQNKSNPVLLGTKNTPNNFAHNVWPSMDGRYAFTTDEKPGAYLTAYDVTNPNSIVEVDRIRSNPGSQVIPHNVHVKGDFLVTSYYRDGITIHDISRPHNMVEVGNFDTSPLAGQGFNGAWGVYPFLPSGNVLVSDIEGGLFVLGATYVKGCYLEGTVTDAFTTNPLSGVNVKLTGVTQEDLSKVNGGYAVSTLNAGTYNVVYSKVGYATKTLPATLTNGQLVIQDVQLTPLPPYNLTVIVYKQGTTTPIANAKVRLKVPDLEHNGVTNGIGEEDFTLYYQQSYDVFVGKFGYYTYCTSQVINQNTGTITVELAEGIYDDFTFDYGWTVTGNATTGKWERGIPIGGNGSANPEFDAEYDCSDYAFVTGNMNTYDPDADDVDNGSTTLKSPTFSLVGFSDPHINYSRYFFNDFGPNPPPDDKLKILFNNGSTTVLIEEIPSDPAIFYKWISKSIRVSDFLTPTADMSILVTTSDLAPNPNITEAGFDYFYVSNMNVTGIEEISRTELTLSPNPVNSILSIKGLEVGQAFEIWSTDGRKVFENIAGLSNLEVSAAQFESGVYIFRQGSRTVRFIKN